METPEGAAADFARLLRAMKERRKRSYEELSREALTSRSTLHRYCTGKGVPGDAETVSRIARACGADAREIRELLEVWVSACREREPPAEIIEPFGNPPAEFGNPPTEIVEPAGNARRPSLQWPALAVAVALLALGVSASGVVPRSDAAPAPRAQRITGPAWAKHPKPVDPELFGVTVASDTGLMPSFRVGAVRFWNSHSRWANVEPRPRRYDWATMDRLAEGAGRGGLDAMYVFGGTPAWAAPDSARMPFPDGSRSTGPDDLREWDGFVGAVASRYKGRFAAYEVWDSGFDHRLYTGTMEQLVELTRRAGRAIRRADPEARVVCPSMGRLQTPGSQAKLRRFARLGGFRHCDVMAVKEQASPAVPPETMLGGVRALTRVLNEFAISLPVWETGPSYDDAFGGRLDEERSVNYAVRYFLTGLHADMYYVRRMFFYLWGKSNVPLTLQAVGGAPTPAALAVDRLQRWLSGALIRACGQGAPIGLPANVWQCEFVIAGRPAVIRWTHAGTAAVPAPAGAAAVDRLDGTRSPVRPGEPVQISERPVLIG
ncbi:helix-turn-helix transcriptional regulator [Spirillospora sp. NPDC047279]|uniref:helix-turn-helix domain-containing protein n=1 Tax=Spirillospora sp. NPDC047279 TaxID=3155478 RepID=UPI0033C0AE2B